MKRLPVLLVIALLLTGCGVNEVDINNTLPPEETIDVRPENTTVSTPEAVYAPGDMVKAVDIISNICVDVRYASTNNFTGEVMYSSAEVYLRYSTACKLASVQERLNEQGLSLCIWDGWRPVAAQFALWRAMPDARYVSNPFNGFSGHCRGNTVDITLVTLDGEAVEMPTGFDDFTAMADRDYSDVSADAAENARLLEREMTAEGFEPYFAEWWHYTDSDEYDICESLTPLDGVDITQDTLLYSAPEKSAETLGLVAAGEKAYIIDHLDAWLLVRTESGYGYIAE